MAILGILAVLGGVMFPGGTVLCAATGGNGQIYAVGGFTYANFAVLNTVEAYTASYAVFLPFAPNNTTVAP